MGGAEAWSGYTSELGLLSPRAARGGGKGGVGQTVGEWGVEDSLVGDFIRDLKNCEANVPA